MVTSHYCTDIYSYFYTALELEIVLIKHFHILFNSIDIKENNPTLTTAAFFQGQELFVRPWLYLVRGKFSKHGLYLCLLRYEMYLSSLTVAAKDQNL